MSTGRPYHYGHFTLYTSFHDLINVYSPRSGLDNTRGQNFDVNRNFSSLRSFATSFIKTSFGFYTIFFYDFIRVYSPRTVDNNLVTSVICCKFQKNLFEVWFYRIFFMVLYMYIAPGQGQRVPRGQVLMSTEMSCHFIYFVSLKKNVFEVWFYTFFS